MVQSRASTVDDYIAELPGDRQPAISRLRQIARKALTGFEETIEYGMPYYRQGASKAVGFASQRGYISIYLDPRIVDRHRRELAAYDIGKSCVRAKRVEDLDFRLIEQMFREAAQT